MPSRRPARPLIHPALGPLSRVFGRSSLVVFMLFALGLTVFSKLKEDAFDRLHAAAVGAVAPVLETLGKPVELFRNSKDGVTDVFTAIDQNKKLKADLEAVGGLREELGRLRAENTYLRRMLHVVSDLPANFVTAKVIGSVGGTFSHSIIINAGSVEGLEKGMSVFSEMALVGRIQEVQEHTATILLTTDINSRVPGITELSRERVVVSGMNEANLSLLYVQEDSLIAKGEKVLTTADGEYFPAGKVIGTVENIEGTHVTIAPFFQRHKLEYVAVAKFDLPRVEPQPAPEKKIRPKKQEAPLAKEPEKRATSEVKEE